MSSVLYGLNVPMAASRISSYLRSLASVLKARGAVVGVSGDLNSAVVLGLAVMAFKASRVLGVVAYDGRTTPRGEVEDALLVCELLGVRSVVVDLSDAYTALLKSMPYVAEARAEALEELKACVRRAVLQHYATMHGYMLLGVRDKSELLLGLFNKHADYYVDALPLGDLYRTQVRMLARHLGLPGRITCKPSPALPWLGKAEGGEVRLEDVDPFLALFVDEGYPVEEAVEESGVDLDAALAVLELLSGLEARVRGPAIPKLQGFTVGVDDHGVLVSRARGGLDALRGRVAEQP